jgi:hypothetical protein
MPDTIQFTYEELGIILQALNRFGDLDFNPHLTKEQWDLIEDSIEKIENAI